ncbi:hexosaminidase [Algoriphagus ratkowskyi]|uniref:beta-N-acetylhexosaminidase n=1 Tax=Algoriphagus ratkowskyi TaxID=57028 RepID=A0A2W7QU54_9BACT|nr:glycoside hydrolase family 20 zincin-like fold domain-containing protein [Algoriphagus ratkowskyi]PZX52113.1 hexosaminidase [Algoriphagus ratkowskyi]TXD76123.1 hypothetical protein ESW18_17800 [Algoriphagus ratkowskyi]
MKNLSYQISLIGALFISAFFPKVTYAQHVPIIPIPQEVVFQEGVFLLTKDISLQADEELGKLSNYLNDRLQQIVGFRIARNANSSTQFHIGLTDDLENEEAYKLTIDEKGIELSAKSVKGLFYGIQSFMQLLPPYQNNEVLNLPKLTINDSPAMNWRGLLLDVSSIFSPLRK